MMEFGARILGGHATAAAIHSVCDIVKVASLSDDGCTTIFTPVVADAARGGITPCDCRMSDFKF